MIYYIKKIIKEVLTEFNQYTAGEKKNKPYVVDFCCCIFPHIDESSNSRATTQKLLQNSIQAGVNRMVATLYI